MDGAEDQIRKGFLLDQASYLGRKRMARASYHGDFLLFLWEKEKSYMTDDLTGA